MAGGRASFRKETDFTVNQFLERTQNVKCVSLSIATDFSFHLHPFSDIEVWGRSNRTADTSAGWLPMTLKVGKDGLSAAGTPWSLTLVHYQYSSWWAGQQLD